MLYFGAVTGHYGQWERVPAEEIQQQTSKGKRKKKSSWRWVVDASLLYGQMIKRVACPAEGVEGHGESYVKSNARW